jgi:transposase
MDVLGGSRYRLLEAVLWILNTGAQWHMLPQSFRTTKLCIEHFQTWCSNEILRRVLTDVANELRDKGALDEEECFIGTNSCRGTLAMRNGLCFAVIAATICRRCSSKNSTIIEYHARRPRSLSSRTEGRHRSPEAHLAVTRHYSPGTASVASRIEARTRIDPSGFLHKLLQPRSGHIGMSYIPQRARPFADRLVIDSIFGRAANDGSKRVCGLVERKTSA